MKKYTQLNLDFAKRKLALLQEHRDTISDFKSEDTGKFKKAVSTLLNKTQEGNRNKIALLLSQPAESVAESYSEVKACQAAVNVCKDLQAYLDNTEDALLEIGAQIKKQKEAIKQINAEMEEPAEEPATDGVNGGV